MAGPSTLQNHHPGRTRPGRQASDPMRQWLPCRIPPFGLGARAGGFQQAAESLVSAADAVAYAESTYLRLHGRSLDRRCPSDAVERPAQVIGDAYRPARPNVSRGAILGCVPARVDEGPKADPDKHMERRPAACARVMTDDLIPACPARASQGPSGHSLWPARRAGDRLPPDQAERIAVSRLWSPFVQHLVPYVPGEQPKGERVVKLNTKREPLWSLASGAGGDKGGDG